MIIAIEKFRQDQRINNLDRLTYMNTCNFWLVLYFVKCNRLEGKKRISKERISKNKTEKPVRTKKETKSNKFNKPKNKKWKNLVTRAGSWEDKKPSNERLKPKSHNQSKPKTTNFLKKRSSSTPVWEKKEKQENTTFKRNKRDLKGSVNLVNRTQNKWKQIKNNDRSLGGKLKVLDY